MVPIGLDTARLSRICMRAHGQCPGLRYLSKYHTFVYWNGKCQKVCPKYALIHLNHVFACSVVVPSVFTRWNSGGCIHAHIYTRSILLHWIVILLRTIPEYATFR